MPGRETCNAAREAGNGGQDGAPSQDVVDTLSSNELCRWAQLIAEGSAPSPTNLAPALEERMAREVRRLRRERLVRFLARLIAQDLHQRRA